MLLFAVEAFTRSASIELICDMCWASEDQRILPRSTLHRRTAKVMYQVTIYFRSPSYNVIRLLVSVIVAVLFRRVRSQRVPEDDPT
jgi:hypothetical protein